jgi:hypothetical protein
VLRRGIIVARNRNPGQPHVTDANFLPGRSPGHLKEAVSGPSAGRGSRTLIHNALDVAALPVSVHQHCLVHEEGLEPSRPFEHEILSLARLPIPPPVESAVGQVGVEPTFTTF